MLGHDPRDLSTWREGVASYSLLWVFGTLGYLILQGGVLW